jgi:large repetitive protein
VLACVLAGLVFGVSSAVSAAPIQLLLPQGIAFKILGYDCGGIGEQSFANGFDATSGYPTGDVFMTTTCSTGGKGGHSHTYTAWASVTWFYTGTVVSYSVLSTPPTVDPNFSAFDAYGNEVYNQSNKAYLVLSAGFVPVPVVTGISVTSGPATGGTSVTISGYGFTVASGVSFGGTAAASYTVSSDTSIAAVSPAEGAGTVDVTVTSGGGTSATGSADQFTFVAAPSVSGVSPNVGPVSGGTSVTITGANFTGASGVYFGGTYALFTVNSDTSITATSPVGEGPDSVDVTVTTIGGTSATSPADQFTYLAAPTVTSFTPSSGPVGTNVSITGSGFTGATAVTFNGTASASVTVNSDTSINATVPSGATTGPIAVIAPGGTGTSTSDFTVTAGVPVVSSFTPSSGPVGTSVSITGSGFTGATQVTFNGKSASFTVNSDASISATVPSGATTGKIAVMGPGGTGTSSSNFTVTALPKPPTITGFSPTSGYPGSKVTITGTNFTGATSVKLGGTAATFTVNSATKITATVPSIAKGKYKWQVTTPGGTAASSTAYTVL